MPRVDHFFDINCMVGVWPYYRLGYSSPAELDHHMKELSITGGAVSSFRSYRNDVLLGNEDLFADIKDYPAMIPCPHLLMLIDGEQGYADTVAYLTYLREERNVKLVRMRLGLDYNILSGFCRPALEYLSEHRMPLLIDAAQLPGEKYDVEQLCDRYPDLRVVVLHQSHEFSRGVYYLLKTYPNLYYETSFLSDQEELEQIVETAGSRGLLFGTRMPHFEPGRMIARLCLSTMPEADINAIAYGNAERLLREVR